MGSKKLVRTIISVLGITISLMCTFIFFFHVITLNHQNYKRYELEYGWTVQVNDKVYENVTLSEFTFPEIIHKGDVVTLTNTLPRSIPANSTIRILNYLTGVEVIVGGQSQYLYGMDLLQKGTFVGSGYHFVNLEKFSGGREIKIVFYPAEEAAFTNIPPIVLTDSNYIYADFFNSNVLAIFCAVFLFILGNVLLVVGFCAHAKDAMYHRLVPIGAFSYLIGLWSMCNTKFMELYSVDLVFNTVLEYITLYIALIPLMELIIQVRKEELMRERWKYWVMVGLTGILVLFVLITTVLHVTNVMHYAAFVSIFHGIALLCGFTVVLLGAKPIREMEKDERVLNIGLLEILFFGIVDMVRFNLQKYVFPESTMMAVSILPLATLIFIIILLVSYLVFIYTKVLDQATRDTLTAMAFEDSMTGLYNRAKAEELFEAFNVNKDRNCTMILFDVDKLKQTNDTFGHNQGDVLLKVFADSLRRSFIDAGAYVLRMGGDEFLVYWDRMQEQKKIERDLRKLIDSNQKASQTQPFLVEASFGVAFSDEVEEHDAEAIYKLADLRMYEMKTLSHKKRQD